MTLKFNSNLEVVSGSPVIMVTEKTKTQTKTIQCVATVRTLEIVAKQLQKKMKMQ